MSHSPTRLPRSAVALCIGMGVLSVGGTSSASESSSTGGNSTWVIGTLGSVSGPFGAADSGQRSAMVAWQKWTNAHGGINGHKVKVIEIDDKGDPATSLSAVKTLVEQDHAIAIVGRLLDHGTRVGTVCSAAQDSGHRRHPGRGLLHDKPILFATGTLPPAILVAGIDLAKKEGATKAADMVLRRVTPLR